MQEGANCFDRCCRNRTGRFGQLHMGSGGEVVAGVRMTPGVVQKNDDAGSQ